MWSGLSNHSGVRHGSSIGYWPYTALLFPERRAGDKKGEERADNSDDSRGENLKVVTPLAQVDRCSNLDTHPNHTSNIIPQTLP